MAVDLAPQALEEAVGAFHAGVRPLQGLLGGRCEHGKQAHGVGAVLVDQFLRVHAIVLGLGHLLLGARNDRLAVGNQHGSGDTALVIPLHADFLGAVPGLLAGLVLAV